jgi:excisionase family DNA binding protein
MISTTDKLAYTIREASAALSVRVWTLRKAIRNYDLTPRKVGRLSLLARDDLVRWLDSHEKFTPTRSRKKESSHD